MVVAVLFVVGAINGISVILNTISETLSDVKEQHELATSVYNIQQALAPKESREEATQEEQAAFLKKIPWA